MLSLLSVIYAKNAKIDSEPEKVEVALRPVGEFDICMIAFLPPIASKAVTYSVVHITSILPAYHAHGRAVCHNFL
jgi:hypothetical protein